MTATVVDAGDGLPLTVGAQLRARVEGRGDRPFLAHDHGTLTYDQADVRSAALAKGLLAAGVGRGTHVAILHPNGDAFVVAWLAAARLGAVAVPLSTFSTPAELQALLLDADVEVLLSAATHRRRDLAADVAAAAGGPDLAASPPRVFDGLPALRRIVADHPGAEVHAGWSTDALVRAGTDLGDDVLAAAEAEVTPADRMVIVHTSGSTAEPKGVIHPHGALIRHLDNLNELRRYTSDEVLFSPSPFFWIGGFAYSLLGTLVAGARLVSSDMAEPSAVLDLLEAQRPTMVNGFAASVARLAADPSFAGRDLTSIRRGNLYPIMPAAVRPTDPGRHHDLLGMTEAGSVCLVSDDESEQPESRRGSFGQPAPGFEARVVDPDDGRPCPTGRVGELHLRSPFLMEGYYGRERHEVFDADGWYHTGDLCSFDEDGFVYFTGRGGDVIKTAGANVSPREVEQAILAATGLTAHVLGLADPDRGQVVAAAVVADRSAIDPEGLRGLLAERLSSYKLPRRVILLADADVPRRSSGKVDAAALRRCFDAG